jgi:hypothetical protein
VDASVPVGFAMVIARGWMGCDHWALLGCGWLGLGLLLFGIVVYVGLAAVTRSQQRRDRE